MWSVPSDSKEPILHAFVTASGGEEDEARQRTMPELEEQDGGGPEGGATEKNRSHKQ